MSTEEVMKGVVEAGVAVMTVMVLRALLMPDVEGPTMIVVLEITIIEVLGVVEMELERELEVELDELVPGEARVGPRVGTLPVELEREVVVRLELALGAEDEPEEEPIRELEGVLDWRLEGAEEEVAEKVEAVPLLVYVVVVTSTPVVIVYDVEELVLFGAQEGQQGSTYV